MPRPKIGEHFKQTAAMKNLLKKAMLFAAAAMAFVSCQNDAFGDENVQVPGFEVSVNATTSEVARSAFGDYNSTDKTYPTLWEGNEAWWIGVNDKYVESVKTITFSNGNTAANAKFELTEAPTAASDGTYTLYAVSPASAWSSYKLADDYLRFYIARNTQTPTATSCDPASQVLFAKSEAMESADAFSVNFEHLSAYIKFSFVNVAEGGVVNSVTIAADDVNLAGRYQYTPSTGALVEYDRLEKSITLVTESHENLWVAVAPVNLSGKKLTFTLTTDKGILSKEVTMPATAKLESGKVVTFNVDMAGIEYPSADAGEEWQLVTNPAELTDGEYIIVGKSQDGNIVYLPNTTNTSTAPSQKVISVPGLDLTSTDVFTTVLIPEDARFTFTGSASSMTIKNAEGKYLYAISNNNGLRIGTTSDTWVIAKNSNNAKALTLKESNNNRYITLYQSQDWRSYTSVYGDTYNSNGQCGSVFIYTKVSKVPAILAETISVPATGGEGEASYTIKNMEADDVTATFATEWISVEAANGVMTYEIEPNYTGAVRTGKITLASATYGITKDVTVSQAADVFAVSATSVSLKADANSTATFTVTSTYAATLAVSDSAKWSINPTTVAGGTSAVTITVTAKTANATAEAVAGAITVTRTEDSKKLTVNLSQAAAEQGGGDEGGETGPAKFVKVTSAPSDWSGTYLIVYETGKVAFDGSRTSFDATSNTKTVTISNNEIEATDAMKAIAFTIVKNGSNYNIKGASGKYIGNNSNSNGLTTSASALNNTITFKSASEIHIVGAGGAYLRYNSASDQKRFRYYKSSSYTGQKAIQLYKLN